MAEIPSVFREKRRVRLSFEEMSRVAPPEILFFPSEAELVAPCDKEDQRTTFITHYYYYFTARAPLLPV